MATASNISKADALDAVLARIEEDAAAWAQAIRASQTETASRLRALEEGLRMQTAGPSSAALREAVGRIEAASAGPAGMDAFDAVLERLRALAGTTAALPRSFRVFERDGERRRLGEVLVESGLLDADALAEALAAQERAPHRRLGALLMERQAAPPDAVARVIASQLRLDYRALDAAAVDWETVRRIGIETVRRLECLPLRGPGPDLPLAMANPLDLVALQEIESAAGREAAPVVASSEAIRRILDQAAG